jgi:hypothetical protein
MPAEGAEGAGPCKSQAVGSRRMSGWAVEGGPVAGSSGRARGGTRGEEGSAPQASQS